MSDSTSIIIIYFIHIKVLNVMTYAVLEVGRYETVCHTGTSLDGYKSYRHFFPELYHTGTPQ